VEKGYRNCYVFRQYYWERSAAALAA
jgi:hypothetical protein